MSPATARRSLELAFRSPSHALKIEFQGGEPLLNFPLIDFIVNEAERMNDEHGRDLTFVIATNLALIDDDMLRFCCAHNVFISTSLDGPADLHNRNRPRPGRNSWELAVHGIRRAQEVLGRDRVSALMTTTRQSFGRVRDIIDCYVDLGFQEIFLRPMSPYGFAIKTKRFGAYSADDWLDFYREGLEYILFLNRRGVFIGERYATILLKKMLTNDDPGYMDLRSPAGIGIGALVYNYDGNVYASDEGRMLAEMGDETFRLGDVHTSTYADILLSDALLDPLEQSIALSAPMCSDCALEPYCGADPVFHHATTGDFLGRKPISEFCRRNMGLAEFLLTKYEDDMHARRTFLSWTGR
jgi:His-Xaa-Ser system radical SAM maturase HxsB